MLIELRLSNTSEDTSEVIAARVARSSGYKALDKSVVWELPAWRCPFRVPGFPDADFMDMVVPFFFYRQNAAPPPLKLIVQWVGSYDADSATRLIIASNNFPPPRSFAEGVKLINKSKYIKAVMGNNFGMSYTIEGLVPGTVVRHRFRWKFPEEGLANINTGRKNYLDTREKLCRVGGPCIAAWRFDADWELTAGVWVLEILLNDEVAATQSFEVSLP